LPEGREAVSWEKALRLPVVNRGCLTVLGASGFTSFVGQPILAAAAFLGGFCAVRDVDFRQAQKLSGGRFPGQIATPPKWLSTRESFAGPRQRVSCPSAMGCGQRHG
jgi:hypothetical protein